jgi:hypothetical protein
MKGATASPASMAVAGKFVSARRSDGRDDNYRAIRRSANHGMHLRAFRWTRIAQAEVVDRLRLSESSFRRTPDHAIARFATSAMH